MTACVSWLKLEQHHLGELPEVAEHVEGCPSCRQRLASIEGDLRSLPALPATPGSLWESAGRWRLPALVFAVAIALLAVLSPDVPPARTTWKGGELSLVVVGEDGAPADTFSEGDRFKVLLTVVPGQHRWRLAIFQDAEIIEPLEGGTTSGGNHRPLPGAFRLTGEDDVLVCVVVDGTPFEDLGEGAVCQPMRAD